MQRPLLAGIGLAAAGLVAATCASPATAATAAASGPKVVRAAVEPGKIKHVLVVDLENEDFSATFGATSPATYLNTVLVPKGQLVENYYATSHVSLGNYVSQVSGQASTPAQNNDCLDLATLRTPPLLGGFTDVLPGTPAADGQVVGDGCVFPASVRTIGDQLDAKAAADAAEDPKDDDRLVHPWRVYAEDMGLNPARDYGTPDPTGGTTCAHPPIGGKDFSNSASATDQYATRHNPFVYFHSVIDDQARCDDRVVPLGTLTVGVGGAPDTFAGHLATDLQRRSTTPAFAFVTPNLCDDGHDATCVGPDAEGGHSGGLVAADLWLKHWMPMILASPAYRSGEMLVVVTFDESGLRDASACCGEQAGPNLSNPGFSPILGLFGFQTPPTAPGQYPGGGKVGAVLLNAKYVAAGTRNTTGAYNHYSALRSYEDLLGLTKGGTDGLGHLGFAASPGLKPFGTDVFSVKG